MMAMGKMKTLLGRFCVIFCRFLICTQKAKQFLVFLFIQRSQHLELETKFRDVTDLFKVSNDGLSLGNSSLSSDIELFVQLRSRTRGTKSGHTNLSVRVALPTVSTKCFNGDDRDASREDRLAVFFGLFVEELAAGHGDNAGRNTLASKDLGGLNCEGNFRASGNKDDLCILGILEDVGTLGNSLDGRALELRKVLTGEGDNGGTVLVFKSNKVGTRDFITISRTESQHVGSATGDSKGFNRLVSRTVFTETNRVVGHNIDDTEMGQGRQTGGTPTIAIQ